MRNCGIGVLLMNRGTVISSPSCVPSIGCPWTWFTCKKQAGTTAAADGRMGPGLPQVFDSFFDSFDSS